MKRFGLVVFLVLACLPLAAQSVPPPKAPSEQQQVEAVPITRETLEARLAELEHAKLQAIATVNAYSGAIQECKYWLEQLKAAEEAKKAAPPPKPPAKKEPEKKP